MRAAILKGFPAGQHWLENRAVRYALAAVGPISASVTQFLLSLIMLRVLPPAAFGSFTFLLVVSQLSWGIWGALLCAPLPVLVTGGRLGEQANGEATLLGANFVGSVMSLPLFAGMAAALGLHASAVACFAGYGALALMRWFARAYAYVHGQQLRTMVSDVVYSTTVLGSLALGLVVIGCEPQTTCYAALLLGAAVGMLPFGGRYIAGQFAWVRWSALVQYIPIWRNQARWALLGVATTEATANAHVYLITLFQGPKAFAPIAASALLMRPVNVAQNALSDFERPQMARLIGEREWPMLLHSVTMFRCALGAIWLATAVLSVALFVTDPRLLFPANYDLPSLETATILWTFVAALRFWQTPASIMLQAAGEFRPLAYASIWSSILGVAAVFVLMLAAGALWSITGLIVAAGVFLFSTQTAARRWLDRRTSSPPS